MKNILKIVFALLSLGGGSRWEEEEEEEGARSCGGHIAWAPPTVVGGYTTSEAVPTHPRHKACTCYIDIRIAKMVEKDLLSSPHTKSYGFVLRFQKWPPVVSSEVWVH